MQRKFWTLFLVWILTLQATLASTTPIQKNNIINGAIANYNAFASNPIDGNLPPKFLADKNKALREYLKDNKIKGPLPKAEYTKSGLYILTLEGKSITLEIDPILGTIRHNGNTLILKSTDSLKKQLEQLEIFLTPPTENKTVESLFSMIIPSASADCVEKYDVAIQTNTPKYKWYQKIPIEWSLGVIVLAGIFLPAAIANVVAVATVGTLVALFVVGEVKADNIEEKRKEIEKKDALLKELIEIKGAISVAKTGTVPPEASTIKRLYTEDELRFFNLYFKYSSLITKTGGVPLSKDEFLKAIALGDSSEKFCTPTVLDSVEKITTAITLQTPIDPTIVNQNAETVTAIVDDRRKEIPKAVVDDMAKPIIDSAAAAK